jgi:transposase
MVRLKPYFLKSQGKPRIDERRVSSGVIFIQRNGLRWYEAAHLPRTQTTRSRGLHPDIAGADHSLTFGRTTQRGANLDMTIAICWMGLDA